MHLTKFPVVLVLLTAGICRANITIATSRPDEFTASLVEDLVYIVTSCYGDRLEDGLGLVGDMPDTLITTLSVQHLIPVVVIGNPHRLGSDQLIMGPLYNFYHKLQLFIVQASTVNQFEELVYMNMKLSIWWNHMASFIIFNMSPTCHNVSSFQREAWRLNLINAKMFCSMNGTRFIVSYNPFTGQAPISWQRYNVFESFNDHPVTTFTRQFRRSKKICVDLDFEKMQNLGGYPINVQSRGRISPNMQLNRGGYQVHDAIERIFQGLSNTLNATMKYFHNTSEDLTEGHDILRIYSWILYSWNNHVTTYPHQQIDFCIVSQFRGHKSQLRKLLSVIDDNSWYGVIIVYLITLMFFKIFVRQALMPALLNLVRMTCNTGFTNLPGNTASRIYVGCLLFFVVTLQGIYQGVLASLLTTTIPLPNIDSIQDLADFGYETCSDRITVLKRFNINKYVLHDNIESCITKVMHDPLAAYLGIAYADTLDLTRENSLHMSNKVISPTYQCFDIRWDWFLEERVNKIIQRFVEADIIDSWYIKCNAIKPTDFEFDEAVKNNQNFKNIELSELTFAFVILAIGLTCATVTLIVELAVKYKCVWTCKCGP